LIRREHCMLLALDVLWFRFEDQRSCVPSWSRLR
jgi:hypothetical protein